ncbi:metallophosphoesterase [Streptosporangium sp. NPDC001559]|uniref:metallophosphoesterase n=1 Tax=Streptosporangium sp. NPDC001559 TaxID=3366187 RepID=UPI0036ED2398
MGFVVLIVLMTTLVHYYLWRRLVRATTAPGPLRRALTWATVALGALIPVTLVGSHSDWGRFLVWPGFLWLAVMYYLAVFLVVLEVPRAVALAVLRRRAPARTVPVLVGAPEPPNEEPSTEEPKREAMNRRDFVARTAAAVAGAGALVTVGTGVRTALGDPLIERVSVALPGLDPRLGGLRLAVVSDIHLGPLTGLGHTERIVRMINGLQADVVAVVGDLVDGTVAELGPLARPLRSLESRHGAYFVTGNHEYYTANGPDEWVEELRDLGVRPLRNERVEITHAGAVLDLAGVDDVAGAAGGGGPDFERTFGGRDPGRSTVLLAHQPVQAVQAAKYGVDLQLSGHTHGGQMVPFNLIVPFQQPMVSGLGEVDGTQVYVTRGAGFWGPPVRVGAPPEITLLELRPGDRRKAG